MALLSKKTMNFAYGMGAAVVIIGALFNVMAPVLWVIALLSTITVIHRIQYTWSRTRLLESNAADTGRAA